MECIILGKTKILKIKLIESVTKINIINKQKYKDINNKDEKDSNYSLNKPYYWQKNSNY